MPGASRATTHLSVPDEHLDEKHIDAACAWLNVENGVLHRVAEDDFGLDESAVAVGMHERAKAFLADGLGEEGEAIYRRFSGGDLPEGASESEVAQRMREAFGRPSFELGCYLAACKWSLEAILRNAGAGAETLENVSNGSSARLIAVIGEEKTAQARELTEEFLAALRS
jgi:hypothetical protein